MDLLRAIDIINANILAKPPGMSHDYFDALKLGIEALIRVEGDRGTSYKPVWLPLPGETKD